MPTRANPNRAETLADGADANAQTAPVDARLSEALELIARLHALNNSPAILEVSSHIIC